MLSQIPIIPKLIDVFDFTKYYRYRGAYGGRGSGKTRGFAQAAALRADELAERGETGIILCGREFMNSLEDSSMAEVKAAIQSIPWLAAQYDIGEKYIRTKNRRIEFVFAGLRHNLDSIKSKSRILIAWIDEADGVSEMAWQKLLPTVREEGAEIWVTWNPETDGSPTDDRFIKHPPDNSIIVKLDYHDNPFFPASLEQQRIDDQKRMDDGTYRWIWEGAYREESEAQIFAGHYEVGEFEPSDDWTLLQGLDWGFANDPTAAGRCYVWDNKLFISHEAVKVGLELDDTPKFIIDRIPDFEKWETRADCARPESIRYVNRHGLERVRGCKKWPGSVEDGIAHIKSYDKIIIHPRCTETLREFRTYSYKVDRLSGDIKPIPQDADNHCIAKGQTVWTARGEVPIENVTTQDYVMTRKGYKKVRRSWLSRKDVEVFEVDCGDKKLIATGNHEVFTMNRGFVRVDALRYTDDVLIGGTSCQKLRQSKLVELYGGGILMQKTLQIGDTIKRRLQTGASLVCIGGSGSSIMGRFRKGIISTTKMVIPATMRSETSNACVGANIYDIMRQGETGKVPSIWRTWKGLDRLQKSGIVRLKGKSYTASLGSWRIKTLSLLKSAVKIVAKALCLGRLEAVTCFVVTNANRRGDVRQELTTSNEFANGAKQNSLQTKIPKFDFVVGRVRCIRTMPQRVDCYDLEVEDQHEFFASGILVHNCIDQLRYSLQPMIKVKSTVTTQSTTTQKRYFN